MEKERGKMLGSMFFPDIQKKIRSKRLRKLAMWSGILIGCILANYYQYTQNHSLPSLLTTIAIGIILVIVVAIHLNLLRRGY